MIIGARLMKTFILNRLLILFIFFFQIIPFEIIADENFDYIDSVNVRKRFFLNEQNWDLYLNEKKIYDKFDNYKIGFICKKDQDNYILSFFPIQYETKDVSVYNYFGGISYLFDKDKNLLSVMVFYHHNDKSYISFKKENEGKFDIYLFGKIFKRNLNYYFSFDSLKYLPLNAVFKLLKDNNIENEVLINKNDYRLKEEFIKNIILPGITSIYVEDGAKNEFGEYVYIENEEPQKPKEQGLNCSGFLKEIADNYIRFLNPDFGYLKIADLKRKRLEERKDITFQYKELNGDPFFGIDWVKNTLDKINQLCNYKFLKATEIKNDKYTFYDENRGYNIDDLKSILFRDQLRDSTSFYILVFNELRGRGRLKHKTRPIVPEYYHIAVIVPYFFNHHFYLRVFESNEETGFNKMIGNHSGEKVLIFKVPLPIVNM